MTIDPGRPLQPNSLGGPPSVPQALNRYAATSMGQPGVAAGVNSGSCLGNPLCAVPANKIAGLGTDSLTQWSFRKAGLHKWGKVTYEATPLLFHHYAIEVTYPWNGMSRVLATDFVRSGEGVYRSLSDANWIVSTKDLDEALGKGSYQIKVSRTKLLGYAIGDKIEPRLAARLGRSGLDNAFPFAADAGFQLWQDWDNPYLSPVDKTGRVTFAVTGGFLAGLAAKGAATVIFGSNAPALVVLGIGLVIGVVVEAPVVAAANELVFPEQRKLQPLE